MEVGRSGNGGVVVFGLVVVVDCDVVEDVFEVVVSDVGDSEVPVSDVVVVLEVLVFEALVDLLIVDKVTDEVVFVLVGSAVARIGELNA